MNSNDADQSSAGTRGKHVDSSAVGFRPHANMVVVNPPKPEDLQQSYASIVGTDADAKGWYGSMSMATFLVPGP
ncbi:hypothetical protein B0T22DRAFT_469011 [Podospora appendiculata]|uniref:Uncharacterized protein n=1 Tax=Podospora appendiculata TaxID=314037 RepID=A0AAE0X361_9PEZI|nr:hypothetical protein B0T22DRAFT_469011 [Podospora appendiculata]